MTCRSFTDSSISSRVENLWREIAEGRQVPKPELHRQMFLRAITDLAVFIVLIVRHPDGKDEIAKDRITGGSG